MKTAGLDPVALLSGAGIRPIALWPTAIVILAAALLAWVRIPVMVLMLFIAARVPSGKAKGFRRLSATRIGGAPSSSAALSFTLAFG